MRSLGEIAREIVTRMRMRGAEDFRAKVVPGNIGSGFNGDCHSCRNPSPMLGLVNGNLSEASGSGELRFGAGDTNGAQNGVCAHDRA